MPSPALPFPIAASTDFVIPVGDSLIQNGLFCPTRNRIHSAQRAARFSAVAKPSRTRPTRDWQMPFPMSGISATGVDHLAANVATRLVSYQALYPTRRARVLWLVSVNDLAKAVSQPGSGTWSPAAATVADAVDAGMPGVKVCLVGVTFNGEQWAAGPAWAATAANQQIADLNSEAQAFAATRGYYWVNVRTQLLGYEQVFNTGPPGVNSGIVTADGVHPNVLSNTGDRLVEGFISANFSVTL